MKRARLEEIHDSLIARIAEAQREGGLVRSTDSSQPRRAEDKLAQLDRRACNRTTVALGVPVAPRRPGLPDFLSSEKPAYAARCCGPIPCSCRG